MKDISTTEVCPRDDIAAYLDGELSQPLSERLEAHLRECPVCDRSMRQQRQMLAAISASLRTETDLELPKDFTRKVVVQAESSVSGLRRPNELFTAVIICVALVLFSTFAIGSESLPIASAAGGIFEKVFAFAAYGARLIISVALAVAVVVRGLCSPLRAGGAAALAILPGAAFILLFSSRRLMRRRNV